MKTNLPNLSAETILALDEWLGHAFESDGVCEYCEKTALELSKKSGLPLCDNGNEGKAIERAMRF